MSRAVGVVTDSSANLAPEFAAERDIVVVPLRVVISGVQYLETDEVGPDDVTEALRSRNKVTTSRPSPQAFLAEYRRLADLGCSTVVSIHLSAEVSGTYESAVLGAKDAPVPVHVIDSRTLGLGLGFSVVTAADLADAGTPGEAVAAAALARASASRSLFYVDTLEYLRRGGRVSVARALLGSALAVKPLLHICDGKIEVLEKVRTGAKARSRLLDLAVESATAAADEPVIDLAVQHLAATARATELAEQLRGRIPNVGTVVVREVGAALGAHVGPGMVAVVVAPRASG